MDSSGLDDAARDVILAEVVDLELLLLKPTIRGDADTVRRLLREDFEEIGASGRHWHRDAIVDYLAEHPGDGAEASQIDASFLAPDVVLVTYAARSFGEDRAISRRSSIWVRDHHGHWAIRYHQGTPVGV